MDILEAIEKRKSIRAFKPDPVPRELLEEILGNALRAPSWANSQPWEFAVVVGKELEEIKRAYLEKAEQAANPDFPGPSEYPEPYVSRMIGLMSRMGELGGREREDMAMRLEWQEKGLGLYGAPAAIYIYTGRSFCFQGDSFNVWPLFDCGLVAESIMLLATRHGLGTIAQMQAVHYPDILRNKLSIPDSKVIVLGISIGYPDWDDPINRLRSDRDSLKNVARWYGFE